MKYHRHKDISLFLLLRLPGDFNFVDIIWSNIMFLLLLFVKKSEINFSLKSKQAKTETHCQYFWNYLFYMTWVITDLAIIAYIFISTSSNVMTILFTMSAHFIINLVIISCCCTILYTILSCVWSLRSLLQKKK